MITAAIISRYDFVSLAEEHGSHALPLGKQSHRRRILIHARKKRLVTRQLTMSWQLVSQIGSLRE